MSHPRILVTGAAGFIGSHLVERLLDSGATVIGIDNFDPFYDPADKRRNLDRAMRHERFWLFEADCADPQAMRQVLAAEPVDVVVHLAAKAGVRPSLKDPVGYLQANVVATQCVLDAARDHGVQRVVFGSSSSVYGDSSAVPFSETDRADQPLSPYAATKRAGELLCSAYAHLYGMRIIALRFFTVYGPRQRPDLAIRKFATLMLQDAEIPMFGDGTTERDYTWIDDILEGVTAAIHRTGEVPGGLEVINLGGNRTTSLERLIELLASALHVRPRVMRLPMQPGDVRRTYADVSRAGELLGYVPRTTIEEGIPRFAAWIRDVAASRRPASETHRAPAAPPAFAAD